MIKMLFASLLLITIAGCSSSVSVSTDYDPSLSFSGYKTFAVYEGNVEGSVLEQAPLIKNRVIEAAKSKMRQKGFVQADFDKADLHIYPFAGTKDKINVTDWGYDYGGYWRGYPYGRNIDVTQYTEASLILDLVDNKSDELIWRGIGTGVVQPSRSPEERTKAIDEAVSKILDEYPPKK